MPMPVLTEEGLLAAIAVLKRDMSYKDPINSIMDRYDEVKQKNPVMMEFLYNTITQLEGIAVVFPDYEFPPDTVVDESRAFVSLRAAQNLILVTVIQFYKALEAKMESDELS
jgi:hypothetical protein